MNFKQDFFAVVPSFAMLSLSQRFPTRKCQREHPPRKVDGGAAEVVRAFVPDNITHPEHDCLGWGHRLVLHQNRSLLGYRTHPVERRKDAIEWERLNVDGEGTNLSQEQRYYDRYKTEE